MTGVTMFAPDHWRMRIKARGMASRKHRAKILVAFLQRESRVATAPALAHRPVLIEHNGNDRRPALAQMLQRRMFTSDQLKKIRVADTSRHIARSQKQTRPDHRRGQRS
jgi:hypothetical protein